MHFQCFVEQKWFHLIGIICGLAIYNSTVVDLHFPLALYKKLLGVSPTLEDFKELSPTEARSQVVQNRECSAGHFTNNIDCFFFLRYSDGSFDFVLGTEPAASSLS